MARADFITALILMCLGSGVVVEAWRMPRYTEFGTSIWSAPGIVPGMLGIALALMGLGLFMRARGEIATGSRTSLEKDAAEEAALGFEKTGWLRVALAFAFCVVFAGVLVGWIPFIAATFLFIFAFSFVFDVLEENDSQRTVKQVALRAGLAAGVALVASFLIGTIFQDIFFVRLP